MPAFRGSAGGLPLTSRLAGRALKRLVGGNSESGSHASARQSRHPGLRRAPSAAAVHVRRRRGKAHEGPCRVHLLGSGRRPLRTRECGGVRRGAGGAAGCGGAGSPRRRQWSGPCSRPARHRAARENRRRITAGRGSARQRASRGAWHDEPREGQRWRGWWDGGRLGGGSFGQRSQRGRRTLRPAERPALWASHWSEGATGAKSAR